MEAYLREAIGLGSTQITPEPLAKPEVKLEPQVTIYDFADLLSKNEPPTIEHHQTNNIMIKIQLL
ncbi:hypothetical protein NIES21_03780 [Anabaenopsis circularis NIES-21]|uniref:Uncharacterized protein n=1 Tax=Anabaenopsis circularis NIES-21 TaxID=1085406 RepID=A0A1Z4GAS9_9CYAN|nr:hypothetical protein NIES21_03780 [Anabaenopsis circularis NIES-21]